MISRTGREPFEEIMADLTIPAALLLPHGRRNSILSTATCASKGVKWANSEQTHLFVVMRMHLRCIQNNCLSQDMSLCLVMRDTWHHRHISLSLSPWPFPFPSPPLSSSHALAGTRAHHQRRGESESVLRGQGVQLTTV